MRSQIWPIKCLPLVLEFEPEPQTLARVKAGPGWAVSPTDDLLAQLGALPEVTAAEFLAKHPSQGGSEA